MAENGFQAMISAADLDLSVLEKDHEALEACMRKYVNDDLKLKEVRWASEWRFVVDSFAEAGLSS